jgi:hypothetical protein
VRAVPVFLHIKVLMSTLVGLSFALLLRGAVRFIQHPHKYKRYWIHLTWALWLFIYLIHFWWWEFHLIDVQDWTAPKYLFIILYSLVLYALTALLFPEDISDYSGYREYFMSRHRWFFGTLTMMFAIDVVDTLLKGPAYSAHVPKVYWVGLAGYFVCSLVAAITRNERFQGIFVIVAILYQLTFMLINYYRLA